MLKISQLNSDGITTLRLEGKILGPWVAELRGYFPGSGRIEAQRLDLAGVDYVDGEGIELLLGLRERGVETAACTAFVAELLGLPTDGARLDGVGGNRAEFGVAKTPASKADRRKTGHK